ncbi:hypothetical protein Tco_1223804 [Tanacetum coccineum]
MDQENQQQDRTDEELVLISNQVRIGLSNYRIALEKQQPGKASDLIWEDFKFQIDSRQISAKKKELLPFPRFTKSMGTQLTKGQGKWLITKKGIEVVVEKKETIRLPRKKRTKTVIEETGQSEEVADEEERRLNERKTSLVIDIPDDQGASYGNSSSESDDEEGFMSTDDEESQEKSDDERTMSDNFDVDAGKK